MRQLIPFQETQRFSAWVYSLIGLTSVGTLIMGFVQIGMGIPVGNHPSSNVVMIVIVVTFGLLFPLAFFGLKLEISTNAEGVLIQLRPFANRTIGYDEIASVEAMTYQPLLEYGGWGVRGLGKKRAYNARGNDGVLLTLKDGATVMLGTQRMVELESVIRSGMSH
ncbi:MAG: hypothetical protein ABL949_07065 [Fimbriimonadaceae bacterium]